MPRRHPADGFAGDEDGPCNVQVDRAADLASRGVVQAARPAGDAGIVDEVGQSPELRIHIGEDARDIVLARHVALHGDCADPGLAAMIRERFRRKLLAQVIDGDVVAPGSSQLDDCGADTAASPGYEQDRAVLFVGGPQLFTAPAVRPDTM